MAHIRAWVVAASVLILLSSSGACSRFDDARRPAPRGTLGEEIVRVACERMAREADASDVSGRAWKPVCRGAVPPPDDAPPRLRVLLEHRARLAGALDRVLPEAIEDDLSLFLRDLLPLYDPPIERLPRNTRLVADLLDALARDDEFVTALARVGTRTGYRPLRLALGVARPALAYPALDDLAARALAAIGEGGASHDDWQALSAALALTLATFEANPPTRDAAPSTLAVSRDLLFSTDPDIGTGTPRYVLRRDARGLAMPSGDLVQAPFADEDGDGFADVDALGRFVDASGARLDVPRPFPVRDEGPIPRDGQGRALDAATGRRLYEYLDVDDTVLAGLVRETLPWFMGETPVVADLSMGLASTFGPEARETRDFGAASLDYDGFETSEGAAFDTLYALSSLLSRPETAATLELTRRLVAEHESEAAGVVHAAHFLLRRGDDFPDARLERPSVFWDDLMRLAADYTAQDGLMEAILRSFGDDRARQLGPVYADLMRYRDVVTYDPHDVNGPPLGFPLDEPVDRSAPDVRGNESLLERSIALIDGLDGVRVCNKAGAKLRVRLAGIDVAWPLVGSYGECELIRIDNVAEAYVDAILGTYELELHDSTLSGLIDLVDGVGILNVDDLLERASGIDGLTRHPTPEALNRLVFAALDLRGAPDCRDEANVFAACLFDRVRDRHGRDVIDTYGGTIFAWEQPGFYEGMSPLLEVLHDARYRRDPLGRYQFGHLITTIYRHWPTRSHWRSQRTDAAATTFSYQEDIRSYEPLLAEGFDTGPGWGNLIDDLVDATQTLDRMDVGGGRDGVDVLADFVPVLLDPRASPGLALRDGATEVAWNDGSRRTGVTPLQLILAALRRADATWEEDPERGAAWRRGRDALTRQLLDTRTLGSGYRFANRRGRALVLLAVPFVLDRVEAHRRAGDLDDWARAMTPDAERALGGPLVAGILHLLERIDADPEARRALLDFLSYLVDPGSENDAQLATIYGVADLLQVLDDDASVAAILRAVSVALAPDVRERVAAPGGGLETDASVANDALDLVRTIQRLDERRVLARLLSNLVALDDGDEAPLETILDVVSEIERAEPGAGGAYEARDYRAVLEAARDLLRDPDRGLERLYDVVESRCVDPPCSEGIAP